jgi:nucleoside 2-deoxyribosyltransferase
MKAYISISFAKRYSLAEEVNSIIETLKKLNIEPFIFVDSYKFRPSQEKEMMQQAMLSIDSCDLLIAETTDKGIGIGVEVGYAKAKGKRVIYIRNKNGEHSTTASGISDFQIIYDDLFDLKRQLTVALSAIVISSK